ncbi:unnamed protein product, partial [Pylaiella littoralis]
AGYVASSFTLGRFLGGYFWGCVADRIGRKPVVIIGLLSITTGFIAFGTSRTYSMALAFVFGLMNGIMPALRTSLKEICWPEHVVRGMTYVSGARATGIVAGTGIGGLLAQPALHYPGVFSPAGLFFGQVDGYPFLLPNLVGALLALHCLFLVLLYLPETRDYKKQRIRQDTFLVGETDSERYEATPGLLGPGGLLATPIVKVVRFLAVLFSYLEIGFYDVYPLLALSTPDVGGLGWNAVQVGKEHDAGSGRFVLVMTGAVTAPCQLFLFPPLIKMVGVMTWQRLGCGVGVAVFLAIPSIRILSQNYRSLFVLSVAANSLVNWFCAAVNLVLTIGSTTLVPNHMRGKLGGLFNTAESLGRFLGPAGYAITYAWSISPSTHEAYGGWVDYRFVFYASAAALAVVAVTAWGTLTLETLI